MKTLTHEFVIPSQVFLVDQAPWPPLSVSINNIQMNIQKPIVGTKLMPVGQTIGNEGVVVDYTVFHVTVEVEDHEADPEWSLPFYACKECLSWIRVAARQYWLGVLMSASDSFARGSVITTNGAETSYKNFGASKTRIPPQPLTVMIWKWIGGQVATGTRPSIPDVMFCDALLNFRDDDFLQTIIQLGVTCELELNALVDDLLTRQTEQFQEIYNKSRFPFSWKLKNMPKILGVEGYQTHNERFANLLCDLYELRGSAVHRAQCLVEEVDLITKKKNRVPASHVHASQFLFAVQDFLDWAKQKRREAGIAVPIPNAPASPIPYLIGPVKT